MRAISLAALILSHFAAAAACEGLGSSRPEIFTAASLVESAPLAPELLRLAHLGPDSPHRREHQVLTLERLDDVRTNAPSSLDADTLNHLRRTSTLVDPDGAPFDDVDEASGSVLTLRAPYVAAPTAPTVALRLGRRLFTLELRRAAGAAATALGGTLAAHLVADHSPAGDPEIVLDSALRRAHALTGAWSVDHDFLIVRLPLTEAQLDFLRGRDEP